MTLSCAQGCVTPLSALTDAGVVVYFCGTCRGTFCPGEGIARWLAGAPAESGHSSRPIPAHSQRPAMRGHCPHDGQAMRSIALARGSQALACDRCQGMFVAPGTLPELRATFRRPSREPRASGPLPSLRTAPPGESSTRGSSEPVLVGDRLAFDNPWVDLLALPVAFLLSVLVGMTTLGQLMLYPVQVQFHELGHALCAWLSSRSALPLPFGFTFWRIEQSLFTGLCMVFLVGVLGYRSYLERRRFGMALAACLFTTLLVLSLVVPPDDSLMLMLAGGIAGEFVLSSLVMVAFFFPLPDRLRWDFFRFLVLLPAMGTWVSSTRLWIGVARGTRPLPMGSILGTPGDGSGDLDRLIASHDFTAASITKLYVSLAWLTGALLVFTYVAFAWRARSTLLRERARATLSSRGTPSSPAASRERTRG